MNKETLRDAVRRYPTLVIPPYDTIMEKDGFEAICAIGNLLGGKNLYVPSVRTIFNKCLLEAAKREYHEKNHISLERLAEKYGFTVRYLRHKIID